MFNLIKKMTNKIELEIEKFSKESRLKFQELERVLKNVKSHTDIINLKLNEDQIAIIKEMNLNNRLMVCIPTGAGKGFIMMNHILNSITSDLFNSYKILVMTHRLKLNNQHFNDIFRDNWFFMDKIVYIIVGSGGVRLNDKNKKLVDLFSIWKNINLREEKMIYSRFSSPSEIEKIYNEQIKLNKIVIVISTYQSSEKIIHLKNDVTYLDEVHVVAKSYGKNLPTIINNSKRTYSFTATPKDLGELEMRYNSEKDEDEELEELTFNNNEILFGKRVGPSFKVCVEKGYIPEPRFQLLETHNLLINLNTTEQGRITKEAFLFHLDDLKNRFISEEFKAIIEDLKNRGEDYELPTPKMLVKCFGTCKIMKEIFEYLIIQEELKDISICIGHSKSETSNLPEEYLICKNSKITPYDSEGYIDALSDLSDKNLPMIVLHIDQMTEGLNINGFTALCLMPQDEFGISVTKFIQNCGRINRTDSRDRDNVSSGRIKASDKTLWFKPYSTIIIPTWNSVSKTTTKKLIDLISELRFNTDFKFDKIQYVLEDTITGEYKVELPFIANSDERTKKDKIKGLDQNILNIEDLEEAYKKYAEKRNAENELISNEIESKKYSKKVREDKDSLLVETTSKFLRNKKK